jgi:superfamily II DNA or RNA helicase
VAGDVHGVESGEEAVRSYREFLASKRVSVPEAGFEAARDELNPALFGFQRDIVAWALGKGRAAIFADTGLGKSAMQLEWAQRVHAHTGGEVLVLAPLAVGAQTVREAAKFGIEATLCRAADDLRPGINVSNYERLHHFDPERFSGLVLDESSILKNFSGVTRKQVQAFGEQIEYRLACTATPAPNDLLEITNHSEFVGAMRGVEIISLFFIADNSEPTRKYRLKGHSERAFYEWMASWAVAVRKPSDLGYEDGGFTLPPLNVHQVETGTGVDAEDRLFAVEARTLDERRRARRSSVAERVERVVDLVSREPEEAWLLWCNLNSESEALAKAIPGAVEVRGSDTPEYKERAMLDFAEGRIKVLVTKPSIAGHGMNWQHCARMAFVGLSDSFEELYQATRRCWRFGQKRPVEAYHVTSELEGAVVENIRRKERQAQKMMDGMVDAVGKLHFGRRLRDMEVRREVRRGAGWEMYLGDNVEAIDTLGDNSVGLSVFSPPFPTMYVYSSTAHDMGNTRSIDEFIEHFRFLVGKEKLLRVLVPGRVCALHLMQLPAYETRDGFAGIRDYRGRVIQLMTEEGWHYAGEATIEKNPQMQATRHKEHALLFKTLSTDSSRMRMALADYLLYFRKPGENPEPIPAGMSPKYNPGGGWITQEEWIEWASPVWARQSKDRPYGIRETYVLKVNKAREEKDERHLCPLQLDVVHRAVKLWSNPGDTILDPFAGVGSVGYEAIQLGRRFVGLELKESYWRQAVANLRAAEASIAAGSLFEVAE